MPNKPKRKQQEPPPDANPVAPPARGVKKSPTQSRAKKLTVDESRAKLLDQFEALRAATQEVIEHVSLRLTAQLDEASRRLGGNAEVDSPPRRISSKASRAMLAALRKLRLKPRKGRLRDLVRIEHTVDKLLDLTEPESS